MVIYYKALALILDGCNVTIRSLLIANTPKRDDKR
jgi:hypothetical protein